MERRALGMVAIILIGLMAIVATAGLDNLPPSVRKSVEAASSVLNNDRSSFDQQRSQIESAINGDPGLFQKESDSWHQRLENEGFHRRAIAAKEGVTGSPPSSGALRSAALPRRRAAAPRRCAPVPPRSTRP